MTPAGRPGPRAWILGAMLGAVLGFLVLGVGGRLAMRGIALRAGQPGGFSLGGTATVVFLGVVAGVVGALVFVALRALLPRRPLVRATVYWLFLGLITLRGLRPVDTTRIILFFPLVLVYGTALQLLWCRMRRESIAPEQPGHPIPVPPGLL